MERELELMKDAGIGGIEINPIAMPEEAENITGQGVKWLSDEWIDYLGFAIKKARDLGMVTDLIVGTGWPFGGEFLDPEETIQGLKVETLNLQGPVEKEIMLPKANDEHELLVKKIVLFPNEITNISEGYEIFVNMDQESINLKVPAGEYTLYILLWQNNFRTVMHGAPGGAGPVLDHFNKNAVVKYLNHMSDAIKQRTGKKTLEGIRAMFCDSIELNGANWTTGFDQIFQERRGYDILPYLPILLAENVTISPEIEDELKRARYDYSLTLSELFLENFIKPFHQWCHENGTQSRYQAYGYPWLYTDLLDGNMIPDIPEGDQWLFNDGWQSYADVHQIRYAIWNKYASSGGHLANRKIISSEAMTNTSGVFKASLKYIKQATDLNIASGINHLVLHGFNYSPPEAGFPGWIRYGCYFNEQNPWWKYMNIWSAYAARLSQVFQETKPVSQVAIMGPTLDIWTNHGLDRNPFNLEPWYLHALWQALNHNGFGTDYVNTRMVKGARLEDGKILIGKMRYEVLMICDVETLEADAARKIEELILNGARIILIGKKPHRSPSMLGALKQNGIVTNSINNALQVGIFTAPAPEDNLKKSRKELMIWAQELMKNCGLTPEINLSNPSPDLFQIHQKHMAEDIVFLANMNETKTYSTRLSLKNKANNASLWDPETGVRHKLDFNENNQLSIKLNPLESALIVFDPKDNQEAWRSKKIDSAQEFEIKTPWEVTLKDIDDSVSTFNLENLKLINQIPAHQDFGGEIIYKTEFEVPDNNYSTLGLDQVYETAEVYLNGELIGLCWWGNNQFDLHEELRKGKNTLEIRVTTLLANYAKSLKDNKAAQYWTNRYKDKRSVKCGLAGKVILL